jgi:hypothetical protein
MNPDRELGARAGNWARMAWRTFGEAPRHMAISSAVRAQPTQRPVASSNPANSHARTWKGRLLRVGVRECRHRWNLNQVEMSGKCDDRAGCAENAPSIPGFGDAETSPADRASNDADAFAILHYDR